MKKSLALIIGMVLLASFVSAGIKIELDPYYTELESSDVKDVDACIYKEVGGVQTPYPGVPLEVSSSDLSAMFDVQVIESPTGADGCGVVRLTTTDAGEGSYVYVVNGMKAGNVLVAEEGSAISVPEFGTIGAGLALLGAGAIYFGRKRK